RAGNALEELRGAVDGDLEALRDEARDRRPVVRQRAGDDDDVVHHCLPAGTWSRANKPLSSAARRANSWREGPSPRADSMAATSSPTRPTGTASAVRPSS